MSPFKKTFYILPTFALIVTSIPACKQQVDKPKALKVSTLAGSTIGYADGPSARAQFNHPMSVAVGINGTVYVSDLFNYKIRRITPQNIVSTLAGSTRGFADGMSNVAKFSSPHGLAVGKDGTIYVADEVNHCIRKITPSGEVTTLAGSEEGYLDGPASTAKFKNPHGLAIGADGTIYVADVLNHRIRKITPTGIVSTLAGSGIPGDKDDIANLAQFHSPLGVAVGKDGTVYTVEDYSHKIRKITPAGVVSTLAGSEKGYLDGPAATAKFNYPMDVAVGEDGTVYVADGNNHKIRKITSLGEVTTLAGSERGDMDGPASTAKFRHPRGVAVGADGTIYVADPFNSKIRVIRLE